MTDKPIIFSAPMVRALLAGRKTQTRRLMPHQDALRGAYSPVVSGARVFNYACEEEISRAPYAPGDRLYVREAFSGPYTFDDPECYCPPLPPRWWETEFFTRYETPHVWYWADGNPSEGDWTRPRPSIHMPRWASRLTLIVESVKVERLHEITREDVRAEGAVDEAWDEWRENVQTIGGPLRIEDERDAFAKLWDSLHGRDAWDANPWVAAISFRVIRENIDRIKTAEAA